MVSKMLQQVYSKGSGKVAAPRNTDLLSCHVTAMAEKIIYNSVNEGKKNADASKSSAKGGENDEPSSNPKKLYPYHTAMIKTVQK